MTGWKIGITKQLVTKSSITILIKIEWQKNPLIHTNKNETISFKITSINMHITKNDWY